MDRLDGLVTENLVDRLFGPERLAAILSSLAADRQAAAKQVDARVAALQHEVGEAEEKLKRLDQLIESGVKGMDDVLKERLGAPKLDRERARTELERILAGRRASPQLDPAAIEQF